MYTLGERFGIALLMNEDGNGPWSKPGQTIRHYIWSRTRNIRKHTFSKRHTLQRVSVQCARYLVGNISFIGKVLIIFIIIFITIIITIIIIISPQTLLSSPHLGKIKWFWLSQRGTVFDPKLKFSEWNRPDLFWLLEGSIFVPDNCAWLMLCANGP